MSANQEIQKSLLPSGFRVARFGLTVDEGISEENFAAGCVAVTQLACFAHQSLFFWIGDLINAGERLFPNKYEQWVEMTGLSAGYLRNAAWVCAHVPMEIREKCPSIQHAMAIAKLPPDAQEKAIQRVHEEQLSATELRKFLKGDPNYKTKALPDRVEPPNRSLDLFEAFWRVSAGVVQSIHDKKQAAWYVWQAAYAAAQKGGNK